MTSGHVSQRLGCVRRVEAVGEQHAVVHGASDCHVEPAQNVQRQLEIVDAFWNCLILEERTQLRGKRQTKRPVGIGTHANAGSRLLLGLFHNVKKRESLRHCILVLRLFFRGLFGGQRKCEPVLLRRVVKGLGLLDCWLVDELRCRRARRRGQIAKHRSEFKLAEKLATGLDVRLLSLHGVQIQFQWHMTVNGDEFLREKNCIAILLERFAVTLALNLGSAVKHCFDAAELNNQLYASFVAYSRRSRDVVDGVSAQGHDVHHLLRRHAKRLGDLRCIQDQVVLLRIQDLHLLA